MDVYDNLQLDNLDNFLEVITGEGVVKKPKFHPAVTATNLPLEKQAADDGCLVVGRVQLSEGAWMAVLQTPHPDATRTRGSQP
mmetsp:Transcript_40613/g.100380  ORF Transcript_40613/g.100380 Transcript_40613/m.100380 type:complete len:83 (-) Transcript_40613:160-408(-)